MIDVIKAGVAYFKGFMRIGISRCEWRVRCQGAL